MVAADPDIVVVNGKVTAMSAPAVWVLFKGYRVTGQSCEIAMCLVVTTLRSALIIGVAMSGVSAARPGDTQPLLDERSVLTAERRAEQRDRQDRDWRLG